ncbi:MAG: MerR family transcriptional regulator [Clostridia bacterium]|nr:MerR family transcriptional regulator [Clostridia bacterium]NCC44092.1 MerR family transcriptional regulator [Clostridia bacterium]
MQKFNIPCIKTGDFAKLCNTNKRTLIHYDEIKLFSPAYTDENGYRYYTESQCDVFFTITCLKDIGMPLKEIKTYIDNRNPKDLKSLLLLQQKKVQQELEHLQRIQQVIQTKLNLVHAGEHLTFHERLTNVYVEEHPLEYLVVSRRLDTSDHETLFNAICQHISYCNHQKVNTGHPHGAMLPVDSLRQENQDIYAHFFTKVSSIPNEHPYKIKPAGKYAVIYLKGNYYDAAQSYKELFAFFDRTHQTPGEFCYKEAVWDELTEADEENYVTKISIQII